MIFLYRKNANSIGTWRISSSGNTIEMAHATVMGGSEVLHYETVPEGKQGRTLEQQVKSRIDSRVSRMRDKGYKDTVAEAKLGTTNQLGLLSPMLAQAYGKISNIDTRRAVLQKKLNGHRCLITKQDGEILAYSRKGKPIPAIRHILDPLNTWLPEGTTIDGELYVHGQALQTLASWIKREQPNTSLLNFVGYDLVSQDAYVDRHEELSDILRNVDTKAKGRVLVLPHEPFKDFEHMIVRRDEVIASKFEGLMMRLHNRGYEDGKRSSSLIKVKKFHDAEYIVDDIIPSENGWGICVCKTEKGIPFKISAPGDIPAKTEALVNKHLYIGRQLTVEYAELTNDGVPFHCSATGWRVDV